MSRCQRRGLMRFEKLCNRCFQPDSHLFAQSVLTIKEVCSIENQSCYLIRYCANAGWWTSILEFARRRCQK